MFIKDFLRLKAMLNNNLAACYCHLGKLKEADTHNTLALIDDPEYAKVFLRQITILEMQACYNQAVNVANWCIARFNNEYESDENIKLVPQFEAIRKRCEKLIPQEDERRKAILAKEIEN
jgi:hypothetical protein